MESEFPSNSIHKKDLPDAKEAPEEKQIKKVIEGEVIRRKKPWSKRVKENFVRDDTQSVGAYVMFDVLIPAAKDMVADAMTIGVERMLFGDVRGSRSRARSGGSSYNRMYANPIRDPRDLVRDPRESSRGREPMRRPRSMNHFDEVILETRTEAVDILDQMYETLSRYDIVTVADFYGMLGVTAQYTDRAWGWTHLTNASIRRIREGYLIDLPRPEHID